MTSQMFSKLKSILGGPAGNRPEQKNSGDPYAPEGFITPEEYPVAYALMKRASRLWNEVNAAGDEMGLGSTPSVPPINNFNNHISRSSCAFCLNGELIPNNKLEHNLIEHFKLWKPYINKFGLIFIELHSCSPEITYS